MSSTSPCICGHCLHQKFAYGRWNIAQCLKCSLKFLSSNEIALVEVHIDCTGHFGCVGQTFFGGVENRIFFRLKLLLWPFLSYLFLSLFLSWVSVCLFLLLLNPLFPHLLIFVIYFNNSVNVVSHSLILLSMF